MLLVDYRAGSKELVTPLQAKGLEVVETTLDFGDIAFEGRGEGGQPVQVGVEFKKLPELIGAMRDGRLEGHQLLGMRGGPTPLYDFAYLFIEGVLLYDTNGVMLEKRFRRGRAVLEPMRGGMPAFEFKKRLQTLHLRGGLNHEWAATREETLDNLEVLYRTWTDKDLDGHTSHLAIYNAPTLVPVSQFRRTINTLPGLALARSSAAQQRFGSLRRAFNAPADEWASVETDGRKLGRTTAGHIVTAITKEHT